MTSDAASSFDDSLAKQLQDSFDVDRTTNFDVFLTSSGSRFVEQHSLDLVAFTADKVNESLLVQFHRDLQLALDPDKDPASLRSIKDHPQLRLNRAAGDRVRGELMLCRYIDSYLTYLSELLREVFVAQPATLKSNDQLSTAEALRFSSISDLIAYVADRKISQLSYSGLGELIDFFKRRLGLDLVDDAGLTVQMREWVALRNLFTHHRGVVDQRALDAGLSGRYQLGEHVKFTWSNGVAAMRGIVSTTLSIDARAAAKFGLKTSPVESMAATMLEVARSTMSVGEDRPAASASERGHGPQPAGAEQAP